MAAKKTTKKSAKTSVGKVGEYTEAPEPQKVKSKEESEGKDQLQVSAQGGDLLNKVAGSNFHTQVKVKKLHKDSKLPVRAHSTDAGLDLFAHEDFTLEMLERKLVGTGVAIQIPEGHVGFIKEKSGLACKGLRVAAGVVDSGFTNEVKILLFNPKGFSWKGGKRDGVGGKLSFKKGEKIAQIVILPVNLGEVVEVDELDESDRGDNGFGSSGA